MTIPEITPRLNSTDFFLRHTTSHQVSCVHLQSFSVSLTNVVVNTELFSFRQLNIFVGEVRSEFQHQLFKRSSTIRSNNSSTGVCRMQHRRSIKHPTRSTALTVRHQWQTIKPITLNIKHFPLCYICRVKLLFRFNTHQVVAFDVLNVFQFNWNVVKTILHQNSDFFWHHTLVTQSIQRLVIGLLCVKE